MVRPIFHDPSTLEDAMKELRYLRDLVYNKHPVEYKDLQVVAERLLNRYTAVVNSGDAGNWDPETEIEVIQLRRMLK